MKYIIEYSIFESFEYENGCIMIEIPINNWQEIQSFVNENDIYNEVNGSIPLILINLLLIIYFIFIYILKYFFKYKKFTIFA